MFNFFKKKDNVPIGQFQLFNKKKMDIIQKKFKFSDIIFSELKLLDEKQDNLADSENMKQISQSIKKIEEMLDHKNFYEKVAEIDYNAEQFRELVYRYPSLDWRFKKSEFDEIINCINIIKKLETYLDRRQMLEITRNMNIREKSVIVQYSHHIFHDKYFTINYENFENDIETFLPKFLTYYE